MASMTSAQAYAARWDLSPYPATRQMPIIPREPIIEPFSPKINIERNLFTPKFSSLKDKRSYSKVTPLVDHRSLTLDDCTKMKEIIEKKIDKNGQPVKNGGQPHPTILATSLIAATQIANLRPKSTPCDTTNSMESREGETN